LAIIVHPLMNMPAWMINRRMIKLD